jgi:Uncharacterized protein conserved in bacteria (DUF2252)
VPNQPRGVPGFPEANAAYERWLRARVRLIPADLRRKHAAMAETAFSFFRATFFRWAERWPAVCSGLLDAPEVLAVGDLHVENFGTWRDLEGRLVWGVNDYDEAWPLPYTNDLVRLATSALLAVEENRLDLEARTAVEAILEGYRAGAEQGCAPFVLAEHHHALHEMAVARLKDPKKFWDKLEAMPAVRGKPPPNARRALHQTLPDPDAPIRYVHRISGLGSLGRERYVAIAEWHGGKVAREAKALAPSACSRTAGRSGRNARVYYQTLLDRAVRSPDPFLRVKRRWIVRRLAPDCSRIELAALPHGRDELDLLHAMGRETANIHLGSARAKPLRADLAARSQGWLLHAAARMRDEVRRDWRAWRAHQRRRAA